MIAIESRVNPAPNVLFRDLGGEAVLLDVGTGSYFGLNEVGARIWQLLAGGETIAGTLAKLVQEYEAPEDQLRADLLALVAELVTSGLLVAEKG